MNEPSIPFTTGVLSAVRLAPDSHCSHLPPSIADPEYPSLDWVPDSSLDHLQAASASYRIAIGPQVRTQAQGLLRTLAAFSAFQTP